MLIDTHAHLFWESYQQDFDEVLMRSEKAGVTTIINIGVDPILSEVAANLNSTNPNVIFYSTIGIHPHEATKYTINPKAQILADIQLLEDVYFQNPHKVIAVGECGLDFFFDNNPDSQKTNLTHTQLKLLQKRLLQAQIDMAKKLNLPLIIHCRDDRSKDPDNSECWKECLEMVKDYRGILHCYSGLQPITHNLPPNFLISFAANVTYPKNDYLKEAIKLIPLERICLETDSPFLAPQSNRGQRNEPSAVKEVAELVAELKGVSFNQVAAQTTQNVKQMLKLN